jgi:cyclophilin family peptidyl-prolyl cis-trans isomerase
MVFTRRLREGARVGFREQGRPVARRQARQRQQGVPDPVSLPAPWRVGRAIIGRMNTRSWLIVVACAALAACSPSGGNPKVPEGAKSSGGMHAVIDTDKGPIDIEFSEKDAPKAVENFRLLAEHGYYDRLTFHRVVKGFMIQGGDPAGNGTGGESAWGGAFDDEINPDSPLYREGYRRGMVAMANSGPNTNGSQFFIMHQDYQLPPNYVIFAKVTTGMSAVDAIAETPTKPGGENSEPVTPPVIRTVTVRP